VTITEDATLSYQGVFIQFPGCLRLTKIAQVDSEVVAGTQVINDRLITPAG
jgi:hypothetical protein